MSELRQDGTSGAWVIVAPERSARPQDRGGAIVPPRPEFDPHCPFCPGNEAKLPGILEEFGSAHEPGWQTRVVPNKYPALSTDAREAVASGQSSSVAMAGYGLHEVVIESPRHDADLASMTDSEIAIVLAAYHRRFVWLSGQSGIRHVALFRNFGPSSGASLAHPHAQLIALPIVPPALQAQAAWARERYEAEGRCALCDAMAFERSDGRRVIRETEHFTAFVPFAAACPFEVWLAPRWHQASFAEVDGGILGEMGLILKDVLSRLESALGIPPYNLTVDSFGPTAAGRPDLHWRLRIAPVLADPGGFELATRMPINPSSPERDASILRSV